jgi:hypothetical protein
MVFLSIWLILTVFIQIGLVDKQIRRYFKVYMLDCALRVWQSTMEKRSVRLDSDAAQREHRIFEAYGLIADSFSDNYRKLLEILDDNINTIPLTPPTIYKVPDCKKFADVDGVYYCVKAKKSSCVQYKPTRLAICDRCVSTGGNISLTEPETVKPVEIILHEPVLVGQQPEPEEEPKPLGGYTPVKGFEKVLFYQRTDGGKFCPFEKNFIVYKFVCKECEINQPEKHEACLTLLRNYSNQKTQNGVFKN